MTILLPDNGNYQKYLEIIGLGAQLDRSTKAL